VGKGLVRENIVKNGVRAVTLLGLVLVPPYAIAQTAEIPSAPVLDSGDTAWMLVSTALVLMITGPGLALFKEALGADDALDVVGVHGIGGMFGALATGFLATKLVNPLGNDGLLYGNPRQVVTQLEGVAATLLFCGVGSFILLKIVDAIVGLRVDEEAEVSGLDLSEHSERGYALGGE